MDTLNLVEQRNKRVSKLEEQTEKLGAEIKDKLESIKSIHNDLDDTAAFPNRQESIPTSVKKDVEELLQSLTKHKFDGLKRRVKDSEDDKRRITDELAIKKAEVVRQKGLSSLAKLIVEMFDDLRNLSKRADNEILSDKLKIGKLEDELKDSRATAVELRKNSREKDQKVKALEGTLSELREKLQQADPN